MSKKLLSHSSYPFLILSLLYNAKSNSMVQNKVAILDNVYISTITSPLLNFVPLYKREGRKLLET